jgi:hypothetical protein
VQDVDRFTAVDVPAMQFVQDVAPSSLYVPGAQFDHDVAPDEPINVPADQGTQEEAPGPL